MIKAVTARVAVQGWAKYADLKALCDGSNAVAENMKRAITRSTTIGQAQ